MNRSDHGTPILSGLWRLLDGRQRRRLIGLQALSILAALSTVGGVAAVIPFLTVLADPTAVARSAALRAAIRSLHFDGGSELAPALGLVFAGIVVLASAINLLALLAIKHFALRVGDVLYVRLFEAYLHRGWALHARTNGAEMAARILHDAARVSAGVLHHVLLLVTSAVTVVFILASIVLLDPLIAGAALAALGAGYAGVYVVVRRRLLRNGQLESRCCAERNRTIAEGLAAVREITLLQACGQFARRFAAQCRVHSRSVFSTFAIAQSPRCALECATVCCLVGVALHLRGIPGGAGPWIARLSFIAFAAYRMLPALQQVFSSMVRIRADHPALDTIAEDLRRRSVRDRFDGGDEPLHAAWQGAPRRELRLTDVCFRYGPGLQPAVAHVSLVIPAGAVVGIMGPNGSGKTTLFDLVSGLLAPQAGRIEIDGVPLDDAHRRSWQSTIAYVPQHAVVLDATVAENIALAVAPDEIDHSRLERAARIARFDECVDALPRRYREPLGERGCRLSGGQRQRLAIARALYRDASLLLLDEATSALDGVAESQIIDALIALEPRRTILLIAHHPGALRRCDAIFQLDRGALVRCGTHAELVPAAELTSSLRRGSAARAGAA